MTLVFPRKDVVFYSSQFPPLLFPCNVILGPSGVSGDDFPSARFFFFFCSLGASVSFTTLSPFSREVSLLHRRTRPPSTFFFSGQPSFFHLVAPFFFFLFFLPLFPLTSVRLVLFPPMEKTGPFLHSLISSSRPDLFFSRWIL